MLRGTPAAVSGVVHEPNAPQRTEMRWCLIWALASITAWILFNELAASRLLAHFHPRGSLAIFNRLLPGGGPHTLSEYEALWQRRIAVPGFLMLSGFWLLVGLLLTPAFFQRCVGEATPSALGAIRILTCGALLISALKEDLSCLAWLPVELRQGMGVVSWLYALPIGFRHLATDATALRAFQAFTELVLVLGLIGWHTRVVIPIATVCSLLFGGLLRQYSFFWHQDLAALYLIFVLSFTPCGDGWSVDRLGKRKRGQPVPPADDSSPVYGWCRYACWVVMAMLYVAAGLSKVRNAGASWWGANTMRHILFTDSLNPMEFDWHVSLSLAQAPDAVFTLLALAALAVELGFVLVLFSRVARRIWPLLMMAMHATIIFLQNILFFDLIVLQLVFFDPTQLRSAVRRGVSCGKLRPTDSRRRAADAGTTPRTAAGRLRPATAISFLALVLFGTWFYRIEFFPLTAMQMYTGPAWRSSTRITYVKALGYHVTGSASEDYFKQATGSMAIDGRFRPVLFDCFKESAAVDRCRKFLLACATTYNAAARPSDRLTRFEIQQWVWDYGKDPGSRTHGEMANRFVLPLDGERVALLGGAGGPADHD